MEQIWCWYGLNDLVFLVDVCQVGVIGVVIVLYYILNGEVWFVEEIFKCKVIIEDVGLVWFVVESVLIYEDIKIYIGNYEQWIVNYQQILCNLVQCGICIVCYNFMLVFDWICIDFEYVLLDGFKVLCFDQIEFVVFEMYILKCLGVEVDYIEEEIVQVVECFVIMSDEDKVCLICNIIVGFLGVEEGYIFDQFCKYLELYKDIDKVKLCENFVVFLKVIILVVEEVGVCMVVYLDDLLCLIFGLLCIVFIIEDMQWMVDIVNSMVNGFIMCIGFYGVCVDNDLVDMIKQFGLCIYFIYLCFIMCEDNLKIFYEVVYLNGDVDMYEVVKVIVEEEYCCKVEGKEDLILMCLDYGYQMLDDLKKKINSGYFVIGCLKGLVEVCGVELVIQCVFFSC